MSNQVEKIKDTADFNSRVLNADRPVAVDFWAEWCGPCKAIGPALEGAAQETRGSAHIVKVNVDEQAELAAQYGISTIPTILYFKDGEIRDRTTGLLHQHEIVSRLVELN